MELGSYFVSVRTNKRHHLQLPSAITNTHTHTLWVRGVVSGYFGGLGYGRPRHILAALALGVAL